MFPVQEVEKALGVSFRDPKLLICAFTHRSIINERRDWPTPHNERLEFLGDAVLELIVRDTLFKQMPKANEGVLTSMRGRIASTISLSHCAKKIGIKPYIQMSRGQHRDNELHPGALDLILADTLEAVIAAIYLDQGLVAARGYIMRSIFPHLDDSITDNRKFDPKSILQDKAQQILNVTPTYEHTGRSGPDHSPSFEVAVYLKGKVVAEGIGGSKQAAEKKAAAAAIEAMGW